MPPLAVSAILAAGIAALAEVVVLRAFDRPPSSEAEGLRIIALVFVAGQAILGVVIAVLAFTLPASRLAFPMEPWLPVFLGLGAFGVAFAFRRGAAQEPFGPRERSRTVLAMAVAQGLGMVGAALAMVSLFLGT